MAVRGNTLIGFRADVKKMFFDRAGVMKSIRADQLRYYRSAGAYAMTTARRMIKQAKKVKYTPEPKGPQQDVAALRVVASRPGEPPKSRTGKLKKNIFFAFDPPNGVIIGPVGFRNPRYQREKVPHVLEHGGQVARTVRTNGIPIGTEMTTIAPRPYMAPTLALTIPKLPDLYAKATRSI